MLKSIWDKLKEWLDKLRKKLGEIAPDAGTV